ncbi:Hsp20/alpha crystallin family protein [Zhengella sp. ZM62]|uniref:Hsp20/alpha crystallin family protein n=1 Tax=Zhengella sedimenti TaxID=3390035 RepID=UPI0039750188
MTRNLQKPEVGDSMMEMTPVNRRLPASHFTKGRICRRAPIQCPRQRLPYQASASPTRPAIASGASGGTAPTMTDPVDGRISTTSRRGSASRWLFTAEARRRLFRSRLHRRRTLPCWPAWAISTVSLIYWPFVLQDRPAHPIRGEKKSEREEKGELTERRFGVFSRAFRLPEGIVEDKITAEFSKGVLKVTMPKASGAKKGARRIGVNAS